MLIALWAAAGRLRKMAYDLFLEHQRAAITWREFAAYGATPGMQMLGVTIGLNDGREVHFMLTVRIRQETFSVEADAAMEAPGNEGTGGYLYLLEVPETPAGSLDECLRLIESQVALLTEAGPDLIRELRPGTSMG
jgi:hypothetical protein